MVWYIWVLRILYSLVVLVALGVIPYLFRLSMMKEPESEMLLYIHRKHAPACRCTCGCVRAWNMPSHTHIPLASWFVWHGGLNCLTREYNCNMECAISALMTWRQYTLQ